jgi:uncharacterized protein YlxW (UPF0749 family)
MQEKINSKIIWVILVSVVCGFLLLAEFKAVDKSAVLTKQDNLMQLSYQIIENANGIFDLQDEFNRLQTKNDSFSFDIKDKTKMKDDIDGKIKSYRLTNGSDSINGRGVEIKEEGNMVTEEIVDLINGIRNTKPDAIGINGNRIIYKSYFIVGNDGKVEFDNKKFDFPITIQIIGDPNVLKKSLDRSGGILDVLKQNSFGKLKFSIENKDNLVLPAYDGKMDYRYAKNTSY